jgi:Tfp pilus assembly protein PilF
MVLSGAFTYTTASIGPAFFWLGLFLGVIGGILLSVSKSGGKSMSSRGESMSSRGESMSSRRESMSSRRESMSSRDESMSSRGESMGSRDETKQPETKRIRETKQPEAERIRETKKGDLKIDWNNIGVAFNKKMPQKAIRFFEKALSEDPNNVEVLSNLALALQYLADLNKALQYLDKALKIDPTYVPAWVNKGSIFLMLKRFNEALTCFDKAYALDPSFENSRPMILVNRGALYIDLGRYREAIACFNKAIALDPEPGVAIAAWNNKAIGLQRLGKYAEAEKCFKEVQNLQQPDVSPSDLMAIWNEWDSKRVGDKWLSGKSLEEEHICGFCFYSHSAGADGIPIMRAGMGEGFCVLKKKYTDFQESCPDHRPVKGLNDISSPEFVRLLKEAENEGLIEKGHPNRMSFAIPIKLIKQYRQAHQFKKRDSW